MRKALRAYSKSGRCAQNLPQVSYDFICFTDQMPAVWTWDRRSEIWQPPDPFNGGTSVYQKIWLSGISLQRVIVRFTAHAESTTYSDPKFRVPSMDVIQLTLALASEFGPVETIAEEQTSGIPYVHVEDATDPLKVQSFWENFEPVRWDLAVRHKNVSTSGQQAQLVLTIKCTSQYGTSDSDHKVLGKVGWVQYDVLFSQAGS